MRFFAAITAPFDKDPNTDDFPRIVFNFVTPDRIILMPFFIAPLPYLPVEESVFLPFITLSIPFFYLFF